MSEELRTATAMKKGNFIHLAIIRFFIRILYFLFTVGNYYPTKYRKNILVIKNIMNQIGIITNTSTYIDLIVQVYDVGGNKKLIEEESSPLKENRLNIYKGWRDVFDEIIKQEEQE